MTGEAGEMADEAARFAARLEKEIGIGVELVDERLTSWEAEQTVAETKSSARRRKPLDDVAAAILLRDYLERTRGVARGAAAEKA
jgi:putative Holliday junction resolvase